MGDITQALRTAQSGLLVNQQALNTVSSNISNVNTPGYSKKNINLENVAVSGIPAGVKISSVTRQVDEGLLKTLRIENGELATFEGKENTYARLQELFGAPGENTSLSHLIESLGEASELLANSPDKVLEQAEFVRRAQDLVNKFQSSSEAIQEQRVQIDANITDVVSQINTITAKIDQLNDDIISNSTVARDVTDLEDQRDIELDKLSKLVDIRYFSRSDGDVVVFTSGGRTLVDTVPPVLTHTAASSLTSTSTHAEGDINGIYVGTAIAANDITNEIREGSLKALVDLRDDILPNLQSQLDELAAEIRDAVNAVHNRGAPFPGSQSMTGTRNIVNATTQTIRLDAASSVDDVKILIFDSTGKQSAATTLNTIMDSALYGDDTASHGTWTITQVAGAMQDWLQENVSSTSTATVNSSGKFEINLNSTSHNLAFRDEVATADGSTAGDASIGFDSNGDGNIDETVSGFANFFGLNDFFVDNLADNVHETNVLESNFSITAATLTFHDATTLGTVNPLGGASLTITAGTSLTDLATQITNNVTNVTASVVPDGTGSRLRISHDNGSNLIITQAAGNTLLTDLGVHSADVRVASTLGVRSDIVNSPARTSTGLPQFDSSIGVSGEYFSSVADDTVAQQLASTFTSTNVFDTAGGLPSLTSKFSEYAGEILGNNANLAATNERRAESQRSLTQSLQFTSDSTRGVNLDEEMADLIVFEQSFAAAARVISVIQNMIETLERAVS
jgi:flagellar hook-associated protein 1 FlgK